LDFSGSGERPVANSCKHCNTLSGSIKDEECLDLPSDSFSRRTLLFKGRYLDLKRREHIDGLGVYGGGGANIKIDIKCIGCKDVNETPGSFLGRVLDSLNN
jgi:hypothetical protein